MHALQAAGLLSPFDATLLSKARVPLLKTELIVPGSDGRRRIVADICIGVIHGPQAVAFAREQVPARPHRRLLRPLRPTFVPCCAARDMAVAPDCGQVQVSARLRLVGLT